MTIFLVLGSSILLQFYAAVLAWRLIRITGRQFAWIFISVAIALMAVRRSMVFYGLLSEDPYVSLHLPDELVALVTSLLVVIGIAAIGPIFVRIQRLNEELKQEVADRKGAEEALGKREEQISHILDSATVHIWAFDGERYFYLNEEWYRYTGQDPTSPLTIERWTEVVHPDDLEEAVEIWRKAWDSKSEHDNYFRLRNVLGEYRYFWCHAVPIFDGHGQFSHFQGYNVDITDRKRAEERIQRQNEFLDTVLESLTHPFCVIDANTYTLIMANSATGVISSSAEATCYAALHGLSEPCNTAERPCLIREVKRTRKPVMLEHLHHDNDGNPRNIEVHGYPLLDGEGNVAQITEYSLDITEKRTAEQERQESELWMRSMFDSTDEALLVITPDRVLRDVNPATERMFGYTREEVVGKSTGLFHVDHEHYLEFGRRISEAFDLEETAAFDFELKRKNGEVFPTEHTVSLLRNPTGDPMGIASVVRDISERKRAEAALRESEIRYRSLFEDSKDAIIVSTMDGRLVDINKAGEDLFGYTRKEMMEMDIRELYADPADRLRFQQEIERHGAVHDYEFTFRRKDGGELQCVGSEAVRRAEDGTILGYQGVIRDITEHRRLEEQFRQAQKMESLGTLAGGVAHDFNNLLTIIQGFSELLLADKKEDDPEYEDLQKIYTAAKNGADLVQGLLAFSRKAEIEPCPVNLNHELRRVRKLLTRTIPKMIEIKLSLADDLERVNADSTQMEQILLNLAVNAKDAMPGGGKMTLETRNVSLDEEYCNEHLEAKPGRHVLLSVSDTGHGMERDVVDRIFEPFYTTKKPGQGTGLGLAMVFGVVKSHGGHITCYSEPGVGTEFKIYLSVIEAEEELDGGTTQELHAFGTETILLVDDEELIRDLGERILSKVGYKVLTAGNGLEALEVYRKKKPEVSLVILDLIMPEMGGDRCLEEFLKIDPGAKVLIASGYSAKGRTEDLIQAGAKGFIGKPFTKNAMLKAIRRVLDEK